jgi:hypothetical protein
MVYKELVAESFQKITVIWHVMQHGLLGRHNYFGGERCLQLLDKRSVFLFEDEK